VHRLTLIGATIAVVVGVGVSAASAASVHVRVEGRTQTIFGAAEPKTTAGNALDALEAASVAGEFYYHVTDSSFGRYVDQIGRFAAAGSSGWVFKVNGVSPPVGADAVTLKDGDRVLWYYATFGPSGGPPTLALRRLKGGCYRVVAQDDQGKSTAAFGATVMVDSRRVKTKVGRACIGPHRSLVRAVRSGAVRSNSIR
jgi:Domain of unknown function (DUF4430)